jgi:hypothetical protein
MKGPTDATRFEGVTFALGGSARDRRQTASQGCQIPADVRSKSGTKRGIIADRPALASRNTTNSETCTGVPGGIRSQGPSINSRRPIRIEGVPSKCAKSKAACSHSFRPIRNAILEMGLRTRAVQASKACHREGQDPVSDWRQMPLGRVAPTVKPQSIQALWISLPSVGSGERT